MSDGYFVSLDLNAETLFDFRLSSQVFRYRVFDIFQRLLACVSLRVATRQIVAPNGKAFLEFDERDAIFRERCFRKQERDGGQRSGADGLLM
jgi:hypothetical protein